MVEEAKSSQKHHRHKSMISIVALILPRPIQTPTPPNPPLLQSTHPPPLLPPRTIHIPARLHTDPTPLPPRGHLPAITSVTVRHINKLCSVELKCGLSAFNFEMETGIGMVEGSERLQRERARV